MVSFFTFCFRLYKMVNFLLFSEFIIGENYMMFDDNFEMKYLANSFVGLKMPVSFRIRFFSYFLNLLVYNSFWMLNIKRHSVTIFSCGIHLYIFEFEFWMCVAWQSGDRSNTTKQAEKSWVKQFLKIRTILRLSWL